MFAKNKNGGNGIFKF